MLPQIPQPQQDQRLLKEVYEGKTKEVNNRAAIQRRLSRLNGGKIVPQPTVSTGGTSQP